MVLVLGMVAVGLSEGDEIPYTGLVMVIVVGGHFCL